MKRSILVFSAVLSIMAKSTLLFAETLYIYCEKDHRLLGIELNSSFSVCSVRQEIYNPSTWALEKAQIKIARRRVDFNDTKPTRIVLENCQHQTNMFSIHFCGEQKKRVIRFQAQGMTHLARPGQEIGLMEIIQEGNRRVLVNNYLVSASGKANQLLESEQCTEMAEEFVTALRSIQPEDLKQPVKRNNSEPIMSGRQSLGHQGSKVRRVEIAEENESLSSD